MPVVSFFFGIVVRMFYREHGVAHFHAEYQGQQATFALDGEMLAGALRSPVALRLIKEWAIAHRSELEANWDRLKAGEPLERIAPLD
jgi:predicted LPLAT superfamily acyltransferase